MMIFLSLFLLTTLLDSVASDCISTPGDILSAELFLLFTGGLSSTRTYNICPGTYSFGTITNESEDDATGSPIAIDGLNPIYLPFPNVHILCGDDGDISNNCIFKDGEEAIAPVAPAIIRLFGKKPVHLQNILLKGFTFKKGTEVRGLKPRGNVYSRLVSSDVTFENCVFTGLDGAAPIISSSAMTTTNAAVQVPSISKVTFKYCTIEGSTDIYPQGLAIAAEVIFDNCTIKKNTISGQEGGFLLGVGGKQEVPEADSSIINENPQYVSIPDPKLIIKNTVFHKNYLGDDEMFSSQIVFNDVGGAVKITDSCFDHNEVSLANVVNKGVIELDNNYAHHNKGHCRKGWIDDDDKCTPFAAKHCAMTNSKSTKKSKKGD